MRRNTFLLLCMLGIVIIGIGMSALPNSVKSAPPDKVGVCHVNEYGAFHLISVAVSAVSAHLVHGDGLPGGPVPGGNGLTFDAQCAEVAPTPTPTPPPFKHVFVSSRSFSGNLGGLAGADAACKDMADGVGSLVPGHTWKAFLSDSTTNASSRLAHWAGDYRTADGNSLIAASDATFFSTSHLNAINIDEKGVNVGNAEVWTGSDGTGTGTGGCSDWTSADPAGTFPKVGVASASDFQWANIYLQSCDRTNVRLYCVEQ